ncbi:MAG: polysaccharide biosynthesis/export family protein [Planctomycetota bacterium]
MHQLQRLVFVCLLMVGAGCSAVGYDIRELAAEINATRSVDPLVVSTGDTIRVNFPFKTDWNHEVRVDADGTASFLMLDQVDVGGLTMAEVDKRLTDLYTKTQAVNADLLTIDVIAREGTRETEADTMFVIGDVTTPGPVEIAGRPLTLIEAISAAGGHLKPTANLRNTILVRRLSTGEMRRWRLDADIYDWGNVPAIVMQPRDILFVPNTAIDDVDIWVDQYIRRLIPLPVPVL